MRSLFAESWLTASGALAILGLVAGSVPLLGLGALVFGVGGMARLWARVSLEDVRFERTIVPRRAFVGERVDVLLRLVNGKRLPVPWIEVREQLPEAMPAAGAHTQPSGMPGVVFLTRDTSLGGRDALEWPFSLQAVQRGFFRVGPTRLRSGDLFGLFEREREVRRGDGIVVYPRTYTLPELGIGSMRPFGELAGGQRIFEDPVRVVGVREYMPGDPLKRIDWSATARSGRLQSRIYEPSRTQSLVVALNVATMEQAWLGFDPLLLERNVTVAASVARWAFEAGAAIGLVANGSFPDADRPIRIGGGRRPDQLALVLEALAMIAPFVTAGLADELERPGHALPSGATVVVITSLLPPELAATIGRLRVQGHAVHVIKTSALEWEGLPGGVPLHELDGALRALEAGVETAPAAAGGVGAAR